MSRAKFIFVTGGVVSSLGKGLNAACLGRLLKDRGLKVFIQKFDPYINVDPTNMSPLQHGEVFVTEDGAEADLDLGHYERFIDINLSKHSTVTSGKVYLSVIEKERRGEFDGQTIQVIPHITNAIKTLIYEAAETSKADIVITEIGGTVGDIESLPFMEAIRQVRRELGYENTAYIHTTLVPYLTAAKELKTKPTQHSVKELRSIGIIPDIIVLRSDRPIPESQKKKIALFCDVKDEKVIDVPDCKSIYEVPYLLKEQKLDTLVLNHFGIKTKPVDLKEWDQMVARINNSKEEVKVALIGKYVSLKDAYLSVYEALSHGGFNNSLKVKIDAIDSTKITEKNVAKILQAYQGIIIPDGFGQEKIEGLMLSIKYARENKIPFLGISLGMQAAIIEYARSNLNLKEANSLELDPDCKMPVITLRKEGKMKLGSSEVEITNGTRIYDVYQKTEVSERYRHRYQFNKKYLEEFKNGDLVWSGFSKKGTPVAMELKGHPFFIAVQYRPEFKSRPNRAHPLFGEFIKACYENKR